MVRKMFFLLVVCIFFLSLVGCGSDVERSDVAVAVFHLEGGTCQNNTDKVSYVYNCKEGEQTYIADPNELKAGDIYYVGYTLEGWYLSTDYLESEKWDFEKDKIDQSGINLYAKWKKNLSYTFEIYSKLDNKLLGTYDAVEGELFDDYLDYSDISGYTCIGFEDETGQPIIVGEFVHPGGDTDVAIKIYANYIEGDYELVSTANQLQRALGQNIYLLNDIDLNGQVLNLGNYSNKKFIGNGYTISNFKYEFDPNDNTTKVSLFKDVVNSTIENVHFENVAVDIGYYSKTKLIQFAPFAQLAENSTISNVTINGTITVNSRSQSIFESFENAIEIAGNTKFDSCVFEIN